jgi:hypothetical protein
MDRLIRLLLQLPPDERLEVARQVADRMGGLDDASIEAEWRRTLDRRCDDPGDDEGDELQLRLWSGPSDAR